MTDHLDPVLLAKWLAGRLSSAEQETLDRWAAADAARAAQLAELRELWERAGELAERRAAGDAAAEDARWNAILLAIGEHDGGIAQRRSRTIDFAPLRQPPRRRWLAAAAAAVLVAGAGVLARRPMPWVSAAGTTSWIARGGVAATAYGERRALTLTDGTRVLLAPGSTLRWASDYGKGERLVELVGEAAFTIAHDAARPFGVRTSHALARDLGTRFDVRAYPGDLATAVVVAEGTVAVAPPDRAHAAPAGIPGPVVLHRGDRAVVGVGGGIALSHDVPLDRFFAWTAGRLVMHDLPMREAVARLNRWYGIEVRYPAGALDRRTLSLSLDEVSAAEAVQVVAAILGLEVSQLGHVYTLHAQ